MLQIGAVILQLCWRMLSRTPRDYAETCAPRVYNYGWGYPAPVFMFVVTLVYSTSAPIILIFGTLYFCFAYVVIKYQLLYGMCRKKNRRKKVKMGIFRLINIYTHTYNVCK